MRRKPYTAIGIKRVPCFRCGEPSRYQWNICADKNQFRGLCSACDFGLNAAVLEYLKDPERGVKIERYLEIIIKNQEAISKKQFQNSKNSKIRK